MKKLETDKIYMYTGEGKNLHVMYAGMIEDKYMFIPYNIQRKNYCGIPCTLTESQVNKHINSN